MSSSKDVRVYIPPVERFPFQYTGQAFNVLLDKSQDLHSRASPGVLHALLTYAPSGPVLTKAGVPRAHQPPVQKDQSESFYCAQLVHYGLKPLATKAAAKKALFKAWDDQRGTLVVPAHIAKLEAQLTGQFWRANEIGRVKRQKETEAEKAKAKEMDGKAKRKRDDDDTKKAELAAKRKKVADDKADKKATPAVKPAKKVAPAVAAKPEQAIALGAVASVKKEKASAEKTTKKEIPRTTVKKEPKSASLDIKPKISAAAKNQPAAPKITAPKAVVSKPTGPKPPAAPKQAAPKPILSAPKPSASKPAAPKPAAPKPFGSKPPPLAPLPLEALSGTYQISAPQLSSNWPDRCSDLTLTISPSSTSSRLWGHLSFGVLDAWMRSSSLAPLLSSSAPSAARTLSFKWRGRDTGSGEPDFDSDNTGLITFLSGGKIKGEMEWSMVRKLTFAGTRTGGVDTGVGKREREVEWWKSEYREFTEYIGGRGGGGWGTEDGEQNGAEESDTDWEEGESDDGWGKAHAY